MAWPGSAEPGSWAAYPGRGADAWAGSAGRAELPALVPDTGALKAESAEPLLLKEEPPEWAAPALPALRPFPFSFRPAAMTVTRTSSPRASSMTAPKMMFASTAAELETS